jgi:hypothetical protein
MEVSNLKSASRQEIKQLMRWAFLGTNPGGITSGLPVNRPWSLSTATW